MLAGEAARAEGAAPPAPAKTVSWSLDYKADVMGVTSGGLEHGSRFDDLLTVGADIDLQRLMGWSGGVAHLEAQNTSGSAPNDLAGTLQGIDNAEVSARRLRLFQAWVEQSFAGGKANLRVGFTDLNSEFDVADSAGLLMAPSFGISPEFSGTGSAGPSIFPSTAMGVRLKLQPTDTVYWEGAAFNAQAGVPGDRGGPDFSFDQGELLVSELGWTGHGKLAAGVWRYTHKQDDIRDTDGLGDPVQRTAQGAYVIVEQPIPLPGAVHRQATVFFKGGVSDARTNALSGAWQAGVLVQPVFGSRENSAFSVGIAQALLSGRARDVAASGGQDLAGAETQVEITYSDQIAPHVSLQPDLQFVRRPGADRAVKDAVILGLRMTIGF